MRILKKAVTLIDIAKACDTSNVTVSKALAGKSGVSDALREKIKQVADEMGYVGVKSTQNRGGNTIGVLIPSKFINFTIKLNCPAIPGSPISIMAAAPSDFAPNGEISWIILLGLADIDDSLAEASAPLSPSAGENKKATVK